MLKDITFKEKFAMLNSWMPVIIETIKSDIKNDHLKNDWMFAKKYFAGKNANKLTIEELSQGYNQALHDAEDDELAEFIINRWLLKNTEVYNYFEQKLREINPDFTNIDVIDNAKAEEIIRDSISQFDAPKTYLFSVLNSVVFSREVYQQLEQKAKEAVKHADQKRQEEEEYLSQENMKKHYEQQMARLEDKYEKKLQGMQKKYQIDVEALKKQVATLQKKMVGK